MKSEVILKDVKFETSFSTANKPVPRDIGMSFTAANVLKVIAGEKTQTRRLLNPQPTIESGNMIGHRSLSGHFAPHVFNHCMRMLGVKDFLPGDTLWVKEGWGITLAGGGWAEGEAVLRYRADGSARQITKKNFDLPNTIGKLASFKETWRSPRFMPRWCSRVSLEILEVRCERVQDISPVDALAEGIVRSGKVFKVPGTPNNSFADARSAYAWLWDAINGGTGPSWNMNPWVWAITFRVTR